MRVSRYIVRLTFATPLASHLVSLAFIDTVAESSRDALAKAERLKRYHGASGFMITPVADDFEIPEHVKVIADATAF